MFWLSTSCIVYELKTKGCERSWTFQHRSWNLCLLLWYFLGSTTSNATNCIEWNIVFVQYSRILKRCANYLMTWWQETHETLVKNKAHYCKITKLSWNQAHWWYTIISNVNLTLDPWHSTLQLHQRNCPCCSHLFNKRAFTKLRIWSV